jgi:hypothetical protein
MTPKNLRTPESYNFQELPVVVPTSEELKDPFLLISRIHAEGYAKYGAVKVVPRKSEWNPKYVFDKVE